VPRRLGTHFTHFTCFTSTKAQILTPEELWRLWMTKKKKTESTAHELHPSATVLKRADSTSAAVIRPRYSVYLLYTSTQVQILTRAVR
jgi:hypothetical protein